MSETDARLVLRARDGEAAAFETLVRRHLRAAHAVALAVLGDPADAEDASQDALIRALERLDQCREPERFLPWLLQIVRNRARNLRRARTLRKVLPLFGVESHPSRDRPDRDAEQSELRDQLLAGLATLTDVQREIVLLHDLEGWKHREIAEVLEVAEGTVRYHLSTARKRLRSGLSGTLPPEE